MQDLFSFLLFFWIERCLRARIYSQFAVCWTLNTMSLPKTNCPGDLQSQQDSSGCPQMGDDPNSVSFHLLIPVINVIQMLNCFTQDHYSELSVHSVTTQCLGKLVLTLLTVLTLKTNPWWKRVPMKRLPFPRAKTIQKSTQKLNILSIRKASEGWY